MNKDQVVYIHSQELLDVCDKLPANLGRATQIHSLIEAYGLLEKLVVVAPIRASNEALQEFHGEDYVTFLSTVERLAEEQEDGQLTVRDEDVIEQCAENGLEDDCSVFPGLFRYVTLVSGGSITAAKLLVAQRARIAIHWNGGRHHGNAQVPHCFWCFVFLFSFFFQRPKLCLFLRDKASGFCYTNDVVLGILELRKKFSRVLYVDIDVHHGDGVERSFQYSPSVMTVSFHKHDLGFFPGTGSLKERGKGEGKNFTVNVPLKGGMNEATFVPLFTGILDSVAKRFMPEAVVMQCGADALAGDPTHAFNLSSACYGQCLRQILRWDLPTLVLGGGGYNNLLTAKCWTLLTAVCLEDLTLPAKPYAGLSEDLPDHDLLPSYNGEYTLPVKAGNMRNENTPEDLKAIQEAVLKTLEELPPPE